MPAFLLPLLLNRYTIGAAVALGLLLGAYWKGYSTASARCHDAELRAQIATLERDRDNTKLADEIEKMLQAGIDRNEIELQKKDLEYDADLKKRPDNSCILSPADADALNRL